MIWKFSKKRDASVYQELIQIILSQLPYIPIFIGDGWNAYQKTCLGLDRECFLIEHLHSHPWQFVRLHHFMNDPNGAIKIQNSVEIPFNSFIQNQPVIGHAIQKKHKLKTSHTPPRKRGRPLGCKDKEKRHSKNFPKPTKPKQPLKKRGRKSIRKNGLPFSFHPQPVPVDWKIEWVAINQKGAMNPVPPTSEVELLLDLTYKTINGKSIQSNRIESTNRILKDITPRRGLKSPIQLKQYLNKYLQFWSNTINLPKFQGTPTIPLRSSVGFAHLFTFFQPRIDLIQIRRDY